MTTVAGVMVRDRTPAMFDDLLTAYPGASYTVARANGITTLTFNVELDETTADAIRERMTSRDDADMAVRDGLRSQVAAAVAEVEAAETLEDVIAALKTLAALGGRDGVVPARRLRKAGPWEPGPWAQTVDPTDCPRLVLRRAHDAR